MVGKANVTVGCGEEGGRHEWIDVVVLALLLFFFFSSRRRHTRCSRDWSSDVCSSDLSPSLCPISARPNGAISPDSPLGRALIGHSEGDAVEVDAPRGRWTARILSVQIGRASCRECMSVSTAIDSYMQDINNE